MRPILLILLLVIGAFVAYNYYEGNGHWRSPFSEPSTRPVGTTGSFDAQKARERGAELGEKAADAANKVGETVAEAAITTKIKAKMALDDTVRSRTVDVTTNGSTVTLKGTVGTPAERARAVSLARETSGVTRVVDRLVVQP
jgi:hyperosmotically inducible protein